MAKNQWTLTEKNDSEGETYGYILNIHDFEADIIRGWLDDKDPYDEVFKIEKTDYSPKLVNIINSHCDNSYLHRLMWCKITVDLSTIHEFDLYEVFSKLNGLQEVEPHDNIH